VGGRPLNRGIDRSSFRHAATHPVARVDFRVLSKTAEKRPCDSRFSRFAQARFDVALNALISPEIPRDKFRCFFRADSELLRQSVRSLAIDDAEIDCFRSFALSRADAFNW